MKHKLLKFVKNEMVLSIAIVITVITCFFIPPDKQYLTYFDYKTLACLFCILSVVVGLKSTHVFEVVSRKLIGLFSTRRQVILALVFGTFFLDMIVANDMSLITLLPLTYIVLHSTNNDKYLAVTFVLQTIAANMGGMLTPYRNPQNLYLYSYYNINTLEFFQILFLQALIVAVLLFICCLFVKDEPLELKDDSKLKIPKKRLCIYLLLFLIVILTIFRIIPYGVTLISVIISIFFLDKSIFKKVDYPLLLTFCAFFLFSGNIARITFIKDFISEIVNKNTLLAGIISCQFISNVPTAIFLSKFTTNYAELLISVNIRSLGILISSLASLITLKEYLKHHPKNIWKYLGLFTLFNTLFCSIYFKYYITKRVLIIVAYITLIILFFNFYKFYLYFY